MNHNELMLFECIKEHYESPSRVQYTALTEADKAMVGRDLVDKIYVTIAEKYNEVDFGDIPKSQGDITAMPEYKNLKASLDLLVEIQASSKQVIPEITTLTTALSNIIALKDSFYMGYVKQNAAVIMLYNTMAMALMCGTSLMISVLVDFVNLGNSDSVQVIINSKYKKGSSYLLINALDQFNAQCKDGSIRKNIQTMMKAPLQEAFNPLDYLTPSAKNGVLKGATIIAAVVLSFHIIPMIKELIYLFYYSRMKISEAAAIQAQLVNANIQNLQANGTGTSKMIRIQKWFADKMISISHAFAFSYEKSEKKAEKEAKAKLTQDDVVLF